MHFLCTAILLPNIIRTTILRSTYIVVLLLRPKHRVLQCLVSVCQAPSLLLPDTRKYVRSILLRMISGWVQCQIAMALVGDTFKTPQAPSTK